MPDPNAGRRSGMAGFTIVWLGQIVSMLGTAMSNFALTIWAFELTGRATDLALLGFFFMVPLLVTAPLVGVLVDRHNRKLMMMLSDLAAGVITIAVLILYSAGTLQIWHLFVGAAISGFFQGFQWPAYSAAITLMLDKKHYARANSMLELAQSGSSIFAPLAAGALLAIIGLRGVLLIDVVTFVFAVGSLFFIHIPEPDRTVEHRGEKTGMWSELVYALRYLKERPSLLMLQGLFLVGNFFTTLAFTLLAPMILARTGSNELIFGSVQTLGAVGGVIGGVAVSVWGGFKRRIHGILVGWSISMVGIMITGLGRPEPLWAAIPIWGGGALIGGLTSALINASNQAIWQSKVAPAVQGRVFSLRRVIAIAIIPLAQLAAGPLADQVMEPAMQPGGTFAGTFGPLVGTGPGAGMSLILLGAGLAGLAVTMIGYFIPAIRNVEGLLPDHDAGAEARPAVGEIEVAPDAA